MLKHFISRLCSCCFLILGSPVVKLKQYLFFLYSLVTVQKTRIKTLNTYIESLLKNLENWLHRGSKKAVKFGYFPKSKVFRMSIEHLPIFFKINSISEFSVPICVFWYVTRLYLKKKISFKPYYRGFQTLKSEYSRNIRLRKKFKLFKNPLAQG